ncbi:MAG: hypothetical protein PHW10_03865 [Candidatus Peribacteraceae bacterium]|nr:hypothetical protein [Candidatus Peribacteraceae bacterium]
MSDQKLERMSFTVNFNFQSGKAFFTGFAMETVVSKKIGAKYRVLVKNPADGFFYTMKGMEEPMTQDKIDQVLEERYKGALMAEEFAFEVFDRSGEKIFATRFNALDKISADGFSSEKIVFTNFSWPFELSDSTKALLNDE